MLSVLLRQPLLPKQWLGGCSFAAAFSWLTKFGHTGGVGELMGQTLWPLFPSVSANATVGLCAVLEGCR